MARTNLHCSFCGRDRKSAGKLVAGPGVQICEACVQLCVRVLTGKATASFEGWSSLDDEELLAALPASDAAVDAVESKLREHVALLRARDVSWERIASALGVSRQAAWERFRTA
jgi:ATP-dependent protease Clp ATPase subunit